MAQDSVGFEASYRRHLATEQRRAILKALGEELGPDVTVGAVIDAAEGLGFGRDLGDLSLEQLAEVLLGAPTGALSAAAPAPPTPPSPAGTRRSVAALPTVAPEAGWSHEEARRGARGKRGGTTARPRATATKVDAPKTRKAARDDHADDDDGHDEGGERMNLERAREVFLPLVARLRRASMQAIEDATGMGRRKVRFHVGQLVRAGLLERHGMGRGTYYTVG